MALAQDWDGVVDWLSRAAGVSERAARQFVRYLKYEPDDLDSLAVSPFFELDNGVFTSATLVIYAYLERNLLRSYLERGGGRAGNAIGAWGERRAANSLRGVPGTLVRQNVPLRRGSVSAGELDVVAWDPSARQGLIFEVKWSSEADGYAQYARRDDALRKGQMQAEERRGELRSGDLWWPRDLPPYDDYEWHWYVVGGASIPRKPRNRQMAVPATGLGYIDSILSGSEPALKLSEVIERLAQPRLPAGWRTSTMAEEYVVGDQVLRVEYQRPTFDVVQQAVLTLAHAVTRAQPGEALAVNVGPGQYGRYAYLSQMQIRTVPVPPLFEGAPAPDPAD
jgi:hypothetical protein